MEENTYKTSNVSRPENTVGVNFWMKFPVSFLKSEVP